jgi:hypothetical protein
MGLHLYCVVPIGCAPAADTRGVDGSAVESVSCARVSCWVSRHTVRPAAETAALRAHNDVVVAATSTAATPVPLRFGQWLEDETAVRRTIDEDGERWAQLLDRFAGHAEYGIRVAAALEAARDVRPAVSVTGREYMAELARSQALAAGWRARADRLAGELRDRAGDLIRDSRMEPPARAGGTFAFAHLVAWADVKAYREAIGDVRRRHEDLRLLCTGPWPPYSFAT